MRQPARQRRRTNRTSQKRTQPDGRTAVGFVLTNRYRDRVAKPKRGQHGLARRGRPVGDASLERLQHRATDRRDAVGRRGRQARDDRLIAGRAGQQVRLERGPDRHSAEEQPGPGGGINFGQFNGLGQHIGQALLRSHPHSVPLSRAVCIRSCTPAPQLSVRIRINVRRRKVIAFE